MTKALNEGYELYGAPTMTFNGTDVIVGQVVIKEVADPTMTFNGTDVIVGQVVIKEVADESEIPGIKRCTKSVIQCILLNNKRIRHAGLNV